MQILGIAVDRLGTASRLVVGAIALATIAVIAYIVMSAGGAAYTPAFTNLDARSAGDLQSALAGAGIATKLSDGGSEGPCGWLKDKFGLSWQVVPTVLYEMLLDPDREKVKRVTHAFLHMKKFDIAELKRVFAGA